MRRDSLGFWMAVALVVGNMIGSGLAFTYGLYAIGGAGAETVNWGFLLLIGGLPVFVWVTREHV